MIDREKVIKGLEIHTGLLSSCKDGCPYFIGDGSKCKDLLKDALELLKEQPQIVRCKDCKWWNSNLGEICVRGHGYPGADCFCSDGERRDDAS